MKVYKPKHEMNEGDIIAGVVYAAAAEQAIRQHFEHFESHPDPMNQYPHQPTIIGYIVEVNE